VTGNDFTNNNYAEYPSFFKRLNENNSDWHTVSICHWGPINDFIIQDEADFKLNVGSDQEVADQAASYISVNDPDAIFLHFDDTDIVGHSTGFSPNSSEYIAVIETIDAQIGTVLQAIEQRPTYEEEDWLIIVTTDHGGLGTSHGGTSIEERDVFIIASGNEVPTELVLKDSMVFVEDVFNCLGDSIELVFDGENDMVQVAPNSIFDFGANQDFTVECRVRTSISADVAIVGNKDWNTGLNKGFVFSFEFPSGPAWKVNIGDGNNRADLDTGGEIADNEWHTLSVSFDRDGFMKLFEDGILLDSADISGIGDITTNEGLFFGTDINGNFDYSGSIAEVRVWNGLLNNQTIADWTCAAIDATHPNFAQLLGYWKMNEGFGTTEILDHSNNGNNAPIVDAIWDLPDSTVVYNYDNTPRQVDIVPTIFNHLCINIDEGWDLEGNPLVDECMISNTTAVENKSRFKITPNPTHDRVQLSFKDVRLDGSENIIIYNDLGQSVLERSIFGAEMEVNLRGFEAGIYFIVLKTSKGETTQRLIID